MSLRFDTISGPEIADVIDELATLRGQVFRDWPYLYDADPGYERKYLSGYAEDGAIVVVARAGDRIVGAATGMPILRHVDNLSTALQSRYADLHAVFYCAESVLLSEYRGQGAGHHFFDQREQFAKSSGFIHSVFCAVDRPISHPAFPPEYRPLAPFWRTRGYQPLGITAKMAWRDIGDDGETAKTMRFWGRKL